ncbi:hypothetical protein P167DRAFT_248798 [Morchella conica CCBAS932]|uniref:Uncharacterized protein n=1 Tax=Morchella conica CCBAS932 TaxID=1392247 RepID=A0A3N4KJ32_9PEZI|nr:hypothetical protein P167DRAFT_248798 [Morchella conica CCBAS932]
MCRSIMKVSCRLIFRLAFSGPAMSTHEQAERQVTDRDEGGGGKFGNWELGIAMFMLLSLGLSSLCICICICICIRPYLYLALSLITSNPAECYCC